MASLKQVSKARGKVRQQVIFVHGLDGDQIETWQSLATPPELWPKWLAEDFEGVAVWTIGYKAEKTRWFASNSMHIIDRGENIFEILVSEKKLKIGELIFVGHSLGGLVIKQLLRVAESQALHRTEVSDFIERVRRIAFLGTPHFGSSLSSLAIFLRIISRPSQATYSLVRGDANLRDLNNWYKSWSHTHQIEHLILMESELSKLLGPLKAKIVEPDSADPGLFSKAIMVDADHYNICKPQSRESEIYIHIHNFIHRQLNTAHRDTLITNKLDQGFTKLEILEDMTGEGFANLTNELASQPEKTAALISAEFRDEFAKSESNRAFSHELFDTEIEKILSVIRKSRFFGGLNTLDKVNVLAERLIDGGLSDGTPSVKSKALAWCSRLQSTDDEARAIISLEQAKKLGVCDEVEVAEAFLQAKRTDPASALEMLMTSPSSLKYSAAFMLLILHDGVEKALQWKDKSHISLSDFDADGKISYLKALFRIHQWDLALESAQTIVDMGPHDDPALLNLVAMAHLVMVVPLELRETVLTQIPFASKEFPLSSDNTSLGLRNTAMKLFSQCSILAREIECHDTADFVDDYVLWLELRDPEKSKLGITQLENSMSSNTESALRRFPMAVQFGVKVDLLAIEKEVDRLTARTMGKSAVAGLARFALALSKRSPEDVVHYIDAHRKQLTSFISKDSFYLLEIEALVRSGMVNEAISRLNELDADEITTSTRENLNNIIAASTGDDSLALSVAQYKKTSKIADLAHLVNQLEAKQHFKQLHEFASELFERTNSISDAERLVNTKINLKYFKDARDFLAENTDLIKQSEFLRLHWAWALYREGKLAESKAELDTISNNTNQSNIRALEVNLAISSGDWETLLPYIENEWKNRDERTAGELLHVSQLAKALQPKRAKDLILSATHKGADNPEILSAAYFAASSMGWEDEEIASGWLQDAVKLSGDNGPIRSMSLKDLYENIPEQREQNSKIWQALTDGTSPAFIAAKQLNRTLTDFYLLPALTNPKEPDLRWRTLVPAFSNARSPYPMDCSILSIDATALLTLGFLELLGVVIDSFEKIIIPHSTLGWLFSEKQKAAFHQPSKIEDAKQIGQMLADKKISVLHKQKINNTDLALEVGDELALLLQEANKDNEIDSRQKLVVRSYPVHKLGSFMNEAVDLSAYADNLCSCSSLVKKLQNSGVLTSEESQIALDYLRSHEQEWPQLLDISDNAIIYLDGLSVTYLQFTGVLEKIISTELEIFIHPEEADKQNVMRNFESVSLKADKTLEFIRGHLAEGIESGVIKLCPASDQSEEDSGLLHPTLEIFSASEQSDATLIDDRFLNQHKNIAFKSGESPVLTTLDLLDVLCLKSMITQEQKMSYRTKLRQAGYIFIPLLPEELDYQLEKASIISGKLQETAELKAIREYILQLKMSLFVQLPRDANWISEDLKQLSHYIKNQWIQKHDEPVCIARSEWLLHLIDFRGWSHCFDGNAGYDMARFGAGIHINTLLLTPKGMSLEVKERYWKWIDESVIEPLKNEDPSTFKWLIESAKSQISKSIESDLSERISSL